MDDDKVDAVSTTNRFSTETIEQLTTADDIFYFCYSFEVEEELPNQSKNDPQGFRFLNAVLVDTHALQAFTTHLLLTFIRSNLFRIFFHVNLGFCNHIVARHSQSVGIAQVFSAKRAPSLAKASALQQSALGRTAFLLGGPLLDEHASIFMGGCSVGIACVSVCVGVANCHEVFSANERGGEDQ